MRFWYLTVAILSISAFASGDHHDVCQLGKDEGPGRGAYPRFYFDQQEKICKEFTYGGEGGNGNRFEKRRDCKAACGCSLQKKVGVGRAFIKKFHYNDTSKKCEEFLYGGMGGNANNFDSVTECNDACVCDRELDKGLGRGSFKKFHYNDDSKKCEEFLYRGDGGNANNFDSFTECNDACVCDREPDGGPARGLFRKFHYDTATKDCPVFQYGGVGGNGNNFETLKDCYAACNICNLPKDEGQGDESLDRFYYDRSEKQCKSLEYKGEEGNANNFDSFPKCNEVCGVCDQPLEVGSGGPSITRYYYNKNENQCKEFIHKGGKQNANNFGNRVTCEHACVPPAGEN